MGSGFNPTSSQNNVFFNGKKANITYGSPSELKAIVPDLAGTGPVSITVNGSTATGPVFSYDTSYKVNTFATGFNFPQYLTEDAVGNLYVTNFGDGTVSKVSNTGLVTTFATGLNGITGITADASGNIYVATNNNMNVSTIVRINSSGATTAFANITGYVYGLSIDNSGNIYAANTAYGTICKITTSGAISTFASSLPGVAGLTVGASGNIYAAATANSTVYKITTGGQISVLYRFVTGGASGIAADDRENLFVTVESSVFRINTEGKENIVSNEFQVPRGIIATREGDFYVVNTVNGGTTDGTISKIDIQ